MDLFLYLCEWLITPNSNALDSSRLAVCKDRKKSWFFKNGKVWFDDASHDPLDSASDPLLVTLLPLVQQGPHNGLLRVLYDTAHF